MEGGGTWTSHRQGTLRTGEGEGGRVGKVGGKWGDGKRPKFLIKKQKKIPSVKEFFYKNVLSLTQLENKNYDVCFKNSAQSH